MLRFKHFLLAGSMLLLLGCGGGSSGHGALGPVPGSPAPSADDGGNPDAVNLEFSSAPLDGGEYSLMLKATAATDLYQIAGTLNFDPALYELVSVEAGGSLGGPEEAYFINSARAEGSINFAYTSRWFGRINSGELNLLRLRVRPSGVFSADDFRLDDTPGRLRLRDSHKRELEPTLREAR